ncbi:helix-turn-helix transcriptional regulator [Pseudarthrobacter enclensis]|uniref:XRE family transcriptional regulator n=1 Tax=Pseudarthrobacter enclensis TaxID=993070 RepID=A0A0V8I7M3_9MICC|nr:helix-turn-helix transcriptional regulator [Pseudarthrobacter enclensis]KSU70796.1 XRE family transcriptional regulator [Pseudarthrobacter enclensis]
MAIGAMEAVAAEVRARRTALRLTQRDLADMAGVSERFVRFVERGKPSVQLDSLINVLDTLGLELRIADRANRAERSLAGQERATHSPDGDGTP